ncbi:SDR family NAD(P)-dependent oxidoreductase [Niveispirillum fermenti]|uniref:SDR family NAD(P)-dependent oxidoreductase n=1 Tax=Niveispirillum fermenti TaxID=1233113 RepID=UPI003A83E716
MTHAIYPSLRSKRVLITGGGSGIGAGLVEGFVRQGARVHFLDLAAADSAALADSLAAGGADPAPRFTRCDLTDLDALKAAIDGVIAAEGGIDVLVNNAANDDRHKVEEVTPAYWDDRMAVNLRHLFFATQAVIGPMKAGGGGSVINLGSISWHLALPDIALYQTAKAGIEGMTRALARDLGGDNIRVNCVVPGGVKTPRQMRLWHNPEEEARMLGQQCLKQRVEPRDIAAMVLFLASDDARLCTGHEYFVDAGWR